MKPALSSIRLTSLVATAIVALAACGDKPAAPKETKPATTAKPAAGQPAKPATAKKPAAPKEINLPAILKPGDITKALAIDPAVKIGVDAKEASKGIVSFIWLKPDHEEIKKKNEELLKKVAADEAAGKTVAPAAKKPIPRSFQISVNCGKAYPSPAGAKKSLDARRENIAKKAAAAKTPVVLEEVPGLTPGAFWKSDNNTLTFAKGSRVVVVGVSNADAAKSKEWALAVAKVVASKLP